MDHISRYVQGTVWHWSRGTKDRFEKGVQSDERPVLIISNNIFNRSSPVVNCLTLTSVLKDSPVHVPVHLYMPSHIQCEQIHTIRKQNLIHYKGAISENTLRDVKEKLKIQFNIEDDFFSKANLGIEPILKEILAELNLGFKESKREMYIISLIRDLLASQADLTKSFVAFSNSHHVVDVPEVFEETCIDNVPDGTVNNYQSEISADVPKQPQNLPTTDNDKTARGQDDEGKRGYRKYTEEDILFIMDESNSPDDITKRFGLTKKTTAYSLRNRMKKRFNFT